MPEIDKVIRKGNTLVNIIEQATGEYVTYNLVTQWVDGTPMSDAKCDGKWFRKHGTEYFRKVVDADVPYVATISEIRTSIGVAPYLFKRIITTDRGQEGEWELAEGSSAADNTGTILVTNLGFRIRRIYDDDTVNVKWFGAKGDDSTDDTQAFNNALASQKNVMVPMGNYIVTDELILNQRQTLFGIGSASWTGSNKKSVIKWNGDLAYDKAVVRLATAAVGIEPSEGLSGIALRNLFIDANRNAGFAIYCAYVTGDSIMDNITTARAMRHNIWVGKCWYARFSKIMSYQSMDCGITLGDSSEYIWANQVNGITVRDVRTHSNGTEKMFNEASALRKGYGIGIFNLTGVDVNTVVSENNDGPGVLFSPGGSVSFISLTDAYLEKNGITANQEGRATRNYGLIVAPSSANSRGWNLENIFLFGEPGQSGIQTLWITGTEPMDGAHPIRMNNIWGGTSRFDHQRFTLTNSYYNLGIAATGTSPFSNNSGISNTIFSIKPYNENSSISWGMISYSRGSGDNNSMLRLASRVKTGYGAGYTNFYISASASGPASDNQMTAASASNRYSVIYAATGTINTSDVNSKQDIDSLSTIEKRVAIRIKNLIKRYRFKDAVEKKGEHARIHFGVIAQDVQDAFISEGLDPRKYGCFCKDLFWTYEGINILEGDDIPYGAVQIERLGIRYDELLAFIIASL